jgi:hypothetical protein
VPEDVQYLFGCVVAHRIIAKGATHQSTHDNLIKKILAAVPVVKS